MKYATSQQALQRAEREQLTHESPFQSDEVTRWNDKGYETGPSGAPPMPLLNFSEVDEVI